MSKVIESKKRLKIPKTKKEEKPVYNNVDYLEDLNKTAREVFRLKIEHPELKHKEIAQIMKITQKQVSVIVNQPNFEKALNHFYKEIIEHIKEAKLEAIIRLRGLIYAKNDMVAFLTCKEFLKEELEPNKGGLTNEELNQLKKSLNEEMKMAV